MDEVFLIDGMEHTKDATKCTCYTAANRTCPQCKSPMHYQGVYGGIVERCAHCEPVKIVGERQWP